MKPLPSRANSLCTCKWTRCKKVFEQEPTEGTEKHKEMSPLPPFAPVEVLPKQASCQGQHGNHDASLEKTVLVLQAHSVSASLHRQCLKGIIGAPNSNRPTVHVSPPPMVMRLGDGKNPGRRAVEPDLRALRRKVSVNDFAGRRLRGADERP